jgi:hypothetical protein
MQFRVNSSGRYVMSLVYSDLYLTDNKRKGMNNE